MPVLSAGRNGQGPPGGRSDVWATYTDVSGQDEPTSVAMNDSMDDLSDEAARRRTFRGVHRALKSVDDKSDTPQLERDELAAPAIVAPDDPYRGFLGADDHKTYAADFLRPATYSDEDVDPYSDSASRRHASDGLDLLAPDPFTPNADRNDAYSASGADPETSFSRSARPAAYPGFNPAATRSGGLVPLPNVQDDLRGPSPVFGSRAPVPDRTDTLAGDAMPGGASLQPAGGDRLTVSGIENRPVYRSPEETGGFRGPNRLGVAAPLPSDRDGGSIPEPYRAADVGTIDRADRASGLTGGPGRQPSWAQSAPDVRSPEPSLTLCYDVEPRDLPSTDLSRDHDSARIEGERADRGHDPAVGHSDETAGTEPHAVDSPAREPETPEAASTQATGALAEVSYHRPEPPGSDATDDQPGPPRDARASDRVRKPRLIWTACAAAIAPIMIICALLYTQPDLLKRLEDLANRSRPEAARRVSAGSEAVSDFGGTAPAASPTAAPLAETQSAGEARPPSPEIDAQRNGSEVGVPKLANSPPPILTAPPSASELGRESGDTPASTSDGAPGVTVAPPRDPDSTALPTSAPPDGKAASGESKRPAAAFAPEAAPTPLSPDAGMPVPRARRSTVRRNRTETAASDDALTVRAERLLAAGDILAARTLFQRLVTEGDPRGARGVAQTFDAQVLDRFPASGVVPDQAEAARWRAIAARLETRQRRNQGASSQ